MHDVCGKYAPNTHCNLSSQSRVPRDAAELGCSRPLISHQQSHSNNNHLCELLNITIRLVHYWFKISITIHTINTRGWSFDLVTLSEDNKWYWGGKSSNWSINHIHHFHYQTPKVYMNLGVSKWFHCCILTCMTWNASEWWVYYVYTTH